MLWKYVYDVFKHWKLLFKHSYQTPPKALSAKETPRV